MLSRYIILLLLIFSTAAAGYAQSYDLQFVEVNNAGTVGGFYDVQIRMKATSSSFNLGLANLTFAYNTDGLFSEHSPDDGVNAPVLLAAHNFNTGFYNPMDITEPQRGIVSVNVNYDFENADNGDLISNSWVDVATVRFTIRNVTESSGLIWNNDQSTGGINPVVVYNDDAPSTPISQGTVSGMSNPLPVDLFYFMAAKNEGGVRLEWGTQSELNNDYFEIQRSEDNIIWESLGRVAGNGTTISENHYEFKDENPNGEAGVLFYRLKQVDFNGEFELSPVRPVYFDEVESKGGISIYPNPASTQVTISTDASGGSAVVYLFNSQGKLVKTASEGSINVSDLEHGTYVVKSIDNKHQQSQSVLLIK